MTPCCACIGALLGEARDDGADGRTDAARWRRIGSRLRELGSDVEGQAPSLRFTTRVFTGHLRLLFGMVRANRPWQLAARLSRALTAAAAAGVFALVTPDIWSLASALGWQRLTVVSVGSVLAIGVTLIVGARLWERVADPRTRQQVVLFNIATTATVVIGVAAFYAALFVLSLLAGLLLVVPSLPRRCDQPSGDLRGLRRGRLVDVLAGHCRRCARRGSRVG